MATQLFLGKDEIPVDHNLEDTSRAAYQLDQRPRERLFDFGRQTGGPRFVVSDYAVLYAGPHGLSCPIIWLIADPLRYDRRSWRQS